MSVESPEQNEHTAAPIVLDWERCPTPAELCAAFDSQTQVRLVTADGEEMHFRPRSATVSAYDTWPASGARNWMPEFLALGGLLKRPGEIEFDPSRWRVVVASAKGPHMSLAPDEGPLRAV